MRWLSAATLLAVAVLIASAIPAFAGQASSGELLFYPCTTCHPVTMVPGPTPGSEKPSKPLPNGFTGHKIELAGHDKLGAEACLSCHDDPAKNPGKLKLADGTLIDIKGDTALVCYRCHSTKYKEWKAGTHGKHKPSCVAAGCHDPHTPGYIYAQPLLPFIGSGFQFKVLSERALLMPLAQPAFAAPTVIPMWFVALVIVGLIVAATLIGRLVLGRSKR